MNKIQVSTGILVKHPNDEVTFRQCVGFSYISYVILGYVN